jgi:hypothetical protein
VYSITLATTQAFACARQENGRSAMTDRGDTMDEPDDNLFARIYETIIETNPGLAGDATLTERLERAYAHAVVLGFTDFEAIARFLRYEATAPNFYRQPAIDAWLRAPGQPVEQRFADVLTRVKSRLRRD